MLGHIKMYAYFLISYVIYMYIYRHVYNNNNNVMYTCTSQTGHGMISRCVTVHAIPSTHTHISASALRN